MGDNKAEGIIWVDDGVLMTPAGLRNELQRIKPGMLAALAELSDKPMAIIVRNGADYRATEVRVDSLSHQFGTAIYYESDFEKTPIDSALTLAFLAARKEMGTKPQNTVAIIAQAMDVRHARNAGLSVLGYAGDKEAGDDIASSMSRCGAFNTVYVPQDIAPAVDDFRSMRDYKFVPIGQAPK
jgi:beta-phosphoglucomutase-like phosphatase (HAD superfamily)